MDHLKAVALAATRKSAMQERLKATVVAAHLAGCAVSDLAGAAGTGRQTIYRWIAEREQSERERRLREGNNTAIGVPYYPEDARITPDGQIVTTLSAL